MQAAPRFSIDHPQFTYPRSRNVYFGRIAQLPAHALADASSETQRGRWRERFAGRPINVEIGCNGGHVLLEWAKARPGEAFIGVDWKYKQVFRGAEKAARRGLANAVFLRAFAERMEALFGPGEIDRLCLYFPDPWQKPSQKKNRFVTAERLRMLARLVREGGEFHIKTDHREYFGWMKAAVAQVPDLWEVIECTDDKYAGHPDPRSLQIPEVTLFERIFIAEGLPIHSLRLVRRAPGSFPIIGSPGS